MPRTSLPVAALGVLLVLTVSLAPAGDAVLDAKRDAAAKLLKEGKTSDAQKLYEEVVAQDDGNWADHYALARIYDKAGETAKAVEAYRQSAKLLKGRARSPSERSALSESEKRLKVLDELGLKLEEVVAKFAAELEQLAKAAEAANDTGALKRIELLHNATLFASRSSGTHQVSVSANSDWIDTGVNVSAGGRYLIVAQGTWNLYSGRQTHQATADGLPVHGMEQGMPIGALIGRIGDHMFLVGTRYTLLPERSGRLFLKCNDTGSQDNSGSIDVAVQRR